MTISPIIRARLLGGFSVEVAGQPVERFRTRKTALLLAYLLRYPQRHSREHLLHLFWNGMPEESARNNLRVALATLRPLLEPPGIPAGSVLQSGRHWVGLNPEVIETDVARFEETLRQAAITADPEAKRRLLDQACALYRGEFLTGYEAPWVQTERERLQQAYEAARQQVQIPHQKMPPEFRPRSPSGDAPAPLGDGLGIVLGLEWRDSGGAILSATRSALAVTQGVLMESTPTGLRACFRSVESLLKALDALHQQFRECRFALDIGELRYWMGRYSGVPINTVNALLRVGWDHQILCTERVALLIPQTRASRTLSLRPLGLYRLPETGAAEQIYQLDFSGREKSFPPLQAQTPLRRWLIHVPTSFAGREREMAQLQTLLESAEGRLITIVGPPGVGKSRLALEAAWQTLPHFGEACWWVVLHEPHESITEWLARQLGWEWRGSEAFVESLERVLEGHPALLVLDLTHEISPAQKFELLVLRERLPNLRCLIAAPKPVGLEAEHLVQLEPLPVPPPSEVEPSQMLRYASVQLLVERARRVVPNFALTERNAAAIGALCRLLEGLPLAIEQASARIASCPLNELVEQIQHSLKWLKERPTGMLHHSLYASLLATYRNLPPPVQQFFARLSVFRGAFTFADAQALAPSAPVEQGMQVLLRSSLVQQEGAQYRLLNPVRLFAEEQLRACHLWEATKTAHAHYFTRIAIEWGGQPMLWLSIERVRPNLEAALEWLAGVQPERVLECAQALLLFWERRGSNRGVYHILCQLPTLLSDPLQQLEAARIAVRLATRRGDIDQAAQLLERWLPLAEQFPGRLEAARLWIAAGFYYWMQGNCSRSQQYLDRALQTLQNLNAPLDMVEAQNHLAVVLWMQGELEASASLLEQALAVADAHSAPFHRMQVLSNLANVRYQQGLWEAAEGCCMETLQLARRWEDRRTLATQLTNWGAWLKDRGEYARARELSMQAFSLWLELNESVGEAAVLGNLAEIAAAEGDYETADHLFRRSLERIVQARIRWYLPPVLEKWADLAVKQGNWRDAYERFCACLFASLTDTGTETVGTALLENLARVALALENPPMAARWLARTELLTGTPCTDSCWNMLYAHLNENELASIREESCRTTREQICEELRPVAEAVLSMLMLRK
ncbi:MAG: tetratricopeptide repeat protein [Fimbriimonadales bacterium]|jgi:predicted ATPase|nr:tetratricopeptide repeat protein [Fimbriimonadales bacterium]GBC89548.1 Putative HTH-type transcriptional regulator [bacterium HR14]CUU38431.1 Predicted ATPase [Armatimonadetes bacterium DC]